MWLFWFPILYTRRPFKLIYERHATATELICNVECSTGAWDLADWTLRPWILDTSAVQCISYLRYLEISLTALKNALSVHFKTYTNTWFSRPHLSYNTFWTLYSVISPHGAHRAHDTHRACWAHAAYGGPNVKIWVPLSDGKAWEPPQMGRYRCPP